MLDQIFCPMWQIEYYYVMYTSWAKGDDYETDLAANPNPDKQDDEYERIVP